MRFSLEASVDFRVADEVLKHIFHIFEPLLEITVILKPGNKSYIF